MTEAGTYDPNVAEAWLRQWYRFATNQLNNTINDPKFASFYEKYFLAGAEKIKERGYFEYYRDLMTGYKHVLRRNSRRLERIERRNLVKLALIIIALNYIPLGYNFSELAIAKKLVGIGM